MSKEMSLKDFVKNSLLSIYEGVSESKKKLNSSKINISFEVFVSATDTDDKDNKTQGGIKVAILELAAGKKTAKTKENSAYNKLTFNIELNSSSLRADSKISSVKNSEDYRV